MTSLHLCRCCMARPPDKNLKTQYSRLGVSEVYADMLKECFEINVCINKLFVELRIHCSLVYRLELQLKFMLIRQRFSIKLNIVSYVHMQLFIYLFFTYLGMRF